MLENYPSQIIKCSVNTKTFFDDETNLRETYRKKEKDIKKMSETDKKQNHIKINKNL